MIVWRGFRSWVRISFRLVISPTCRIRNSSTPARFANGGLDASPLLVAAEIFTDLLGIAQRLLREQRMSAGVVVACSVLEDVMRRSARHRKIAIRENVDDLSALNAKMSAAGVYGAALQKRINEWATMRMRAENGELTAEMRTDADALLRGVREFVDDHLF